VKAGNEDEALPQRPPAQTSTVSPVSTPSLAASTSFIQSAFSGRISFSSGLFCDCA
jgi:hypothetical protein